MAALLIPVDANAPHYEIEVELDGAAFRLAFRWNDRAEAWLLDVSDVDGVALLTSRRVVVDLPLLARFRDPRLPAGELIAVDTASTGADPSFEDLGERVVLLYFPAADLPAAFVAG